MYVPGTHFYESGTDFRNNPLPETTYYASTDTDAHGNSLGGRLESVKDAVGVTTTYTYDVTANTTTLTYPPDGSGNVGTATMVYDNMGDLLSSTDPLGHTNTNTYDANQSLLSRTDQLNDITCYADDSNGNRTAVTLPQTGPTCSSIKIRLTLWRKLLLSIQFFGGILLMVWFLLPGKSDWRPRGVSLLTGVLCLFTAGLSWYGYTHYMIWCMTCLVHSLCSGE
jgi:YD repeat-containing protein